MMMNFICPGGEDKKEWKQIGSVSVLLDDVRGKRYLGTSGLKIDYSTHEVY